MADWVYCGSNSGVSAAATQSLLRTHRAIWCSPPRLRPWPGTPRPGERLWLVWRERSRDETILLLGGGRIEQAPRALFGSNLLWTDQDNRGVRAAAKQLGYEGPTSMSFLRLSKVVLTSGLASVRGLEDLDVRLNLATAVHVAALSGLLPIR